MNRRWLNNFSAVMIVLIWFLIIILYTFLVGCASYKVTRCDENGICSTASIMSPRKFEHIALNYDGDNRTFELTAGKVQNDTAALNTLAATLLLRQQADTGE